MDKRKGKQTHLESLLSGVFARVDPQLTDRHLLKVIARVGTTQANVL